MPVTVKKMKLIPVGDKEEKNRVYKYIRDGQYNQYLCMNSLMSQIGMAYYNFDRDIKSDGFKEELKRIMRVENPIWKKYDLPKGLGSQSVISQQLRNDFSTAVKNGFCRGDRTLSQYKREFPLLIPGRLLSVYEGINEYTDDEGNRIKNKGYYIKFVNGIRFKVVLGHYGKKDKQLLSLLKNLVDPENKDYKIAGSSICIKEKDIIINLCINVAKNVSVYKPTKGKIMAVSLGYQSPCIATVSGLDKSIYIGSSYSEELVSKRISYQQNSKLIQEKLKSCTGGHGRRKKLAALNKIKLHEKNYVSAVNHKLSSDILKVAMKNGVETIVLESISKDNLQLNPVMLRNWSYYQLTDSLTYKAERNGITVVKSEDESIYSRCSNCGKENRVCFDSNLIWVDRLDYTCTSCGLVCDFTCNKNNNLLNIKHSY